MNQNQINIVSFDVPFPPNYGGVIDVFYKIKTLHETGYEVILHCFDYGRSPQPELEEYCKKIFYYKRGKGIFFHFSPLPYIAITRKNRSLLKNLLTNDFPILFEGLHTCYYIGHPKLKHRIKLIRMHNVEHHYYAGLAKSSKNIFKKLFYYTESLKLKNFESASQFAAVVLAISENDYKYFNKKYTTTKYLAAFHPLENIVSKKGKGNYFLYHGNLAVEENEKAILFLLNEVFASSNEKLIIAGNSPSKKIIKRIQLYPNTLLIANPSTAEMTDLIENAHCCVLPTFQSTGLKLKLLVSLFLGRHVIASPEMAENTGLETFCEIAKDTRDFIAKIKKIKNTVFSNEHIELRNKILMDFSNKSNGKKLIQIIESL